MKSVAPYSITQTTAISGGFNITAGGITSKGVVWDTSSINTSSALLLPTISSITTSLNTPFVIQIVGLMPNTKYYVRSFSTGTTTQWGTEFSFVTKAVMEGEDGIVCTTKDITINPGRVYNLPPDTEVIGITATSEQAAKLKSDCSSFSNIISELTAEEDLS